MDSCPFFKGRNSVSVSFHTHKGGIVCCPSPTVLGFCSLWNVANKELFICFLQHLLLFFPCLVAKDTFSSFSRFVLFLFSQGFYLDRPRDREALHLKGVRPLGGAVWLMVGGWWGPGGAAGT